LLLGALWGSWPEFGTGEENFQLVIFQHDSKDRAVSDCLGGAVSTNAHPVKSIKNIQEICGQLVHTHCNDQDMIERPLENV
jgi:hypothetical protein